MFNVDRFHQFSKKQYKVQILGKLLFSQFSNLTLFYLLKLDFVLILNNPLCLNYNFGGKRQLLVS